MFLLDGKKNASLGKVGIDIPIDSTHKMMTFFLLVENI